ncbi:hypothetical protein [Methylomonas sp. HYX-M1]|uniref:hypothetical protein n=1 Tax=Methylomonas sp. HYX-M1 TaxID=3139307 RepID=UPI00345BEE3B
MKTAQLSFSIFEAVLSNYGFEVIPYFDSIHIGLDSTCDIASVRILQSEYTSQNKNKIKISPYSLMKRPTINTKIELEQPEEALLTKLNDALSGDYLINEVEFAIDICSKSIKKIEMLRTFFDDHMLYQSKSQGQDHFYHHRYVNQTDYFAKRRQRRGTLVVYNMPSSKIRYQPCVHIEMRICYSTDLKDIGIYSLQDLIDFLPDKFWKNRLDLRVLKFNQLGHLTQPIETGLSMSSYQRRGQRLYENFHSAQHLLNDFPQYEPAFMPITNRRMLESRLLRVLE